VVYLNIAVDYALWAWYSIVVEISITHSVAVVKTTNEKRR
jgi:hypothetical protein